MLCCIKGPFDYTIEKDRNIGMKKQQKVFKLTPYNNPSKKRRKLKRKGFTFVEIIMTIMLLTAISI